MPTYGKPTGPELKQLVDALLSAFPRETDLEQMLAFELDVTLNHIVAPGDQRARVFSLVRWAIETGTLRKLLNAAQRTRPGNAALQQFLASFPPEDVDEVSQPSQPRSTESTTDLPEASDRTEVDPQGQAGTNRHAPAPRGRWQPLVPIFAAMLTASATLIAAAMTLWSKYQPTGVVAGVVIDTENHSVPQAAVELVGAAGRDETDSSGKFSIPLTSVQDEIRLRVTKNGYATKDIRTPPRADIVISLAPPPPLASAPRAIVAGNVSDTRGAGIAGATISIDGKDSYETTTSGNFRLDLGIGAPEKVRLRVRKQGFDDYDEQVSVPSENIQVSLRRRP